MSLSRVALAGILCLVSWTAQADVLGGRSVSTISTAADVVAIFSDQATGDFAAQALLGGAATTMQSADHMSYDTDQRTLLVTDFWGKQVHVFDAKARGDIAPLRTFSNTILGQLRAAVAIPAFDEYVVINSSFIGYFPRSASGATVMKRSTSYLPGLIDNMSGLIYLSTTDEVAVGDYYSPSENVFAGEVLFFDRADSGAVVPTRRIAGPLTKLGTAVAGLAIDPLHGEIFVLTFNEDYTSSIQVFAQNADGNAEPLRSIEGPATLMVTASGISYYEFLDELLVASGTFNNETPRLLGFPRTASGNALPTRNISGLNTGTTTEKTWASVIGLPLEVVFEDGFE